MNKLFALILPLSLMIQGCAQVQKNALPQMSYIPEGQFQMGDTYNEGNTDELPVHKVFVSAFYIGTYNVTYELFDSIRKWGINNNYQFDISGETAGPNHPVNFITWWNAVKFCNARSEKEGLTPVYYIDTAQTQIYRSGEPDLADKMVRWSANGYRLPTEAEWEKSARGGRIGHHSPWPSLGGKWSDFTKSEVANYIDSDNPYQKNKNNTTPNGYFKPNSYGIYDMCGNVWEWVWDRYSATWYSQPGSSQANTHGPVSGFVPGNRVIRGGGCDDPASQLRCSFRYSTTPSYKDVDGGFRCVRQSL